MDTARACPHCGRFYLKDANCNYVWACGLDESGIFHPGHGCGRAICHACGGKYCSQQYDPNTGAKLTSFRSCHDAECCRLEPDFSETTYCGGGCLNNGHCPKRW